MGTSSFAYRWIPVAAVTMAATLSCGGPGEIPPTPASALVVGTVTIPGGEAASGAIVVVTAGGADTTCHTVGSGIIGRGQTNGSGAYRMAVTLGLAADNTCLTIQAKPPTGAALDTSPSVLRRVAFRYTRPTDSVVVNLQLTP
jgi:hypothetical protein